MARLKLACSICALLGLTLEALAVNEGYIVSGISTKQVNATSGSTLWTDRSYFITQMPQELVGSTLFQSAHYVDTSTIEVFSPHNATIYIGVYKSRDGGLMEVLPGQGWTLRDGWFVQWNKGAGQRFHKIWSKQIDGGETISFTTTKNRMTFAIFISEVFCPFGWTVLQTGCYRFVEASTFNQAVTRCKEKGGFTSEIKSRNEHIAFSKFMKDSGFSHNNVWLGASFVANKWIWFHSKQEMTFSAWLPGQPTEGSETCVAAWGIDDTTLWNDIVCDQHANLALCQYSPTSVSTSSPCPADFIEDVGGVHGGGLKGGFSSGGIKECAEECEKDLLCNSFRYKTVQQECVIYTESEPNNFSNQDFIFCKKKIDLWTVLAEAIKSRLDNIPPERDTTSELSKTLQKLDDAVRIIGSNVMKIPDYNVLEDLFLKIVANSSLDDHFPDFASSFQNAVLPTAIQSEKLGSPLLKSCLKTPYPAPVDNSAQPHEEEVTVNQTTGSPCPFKKCFNYKWISTGLYAKQGQLIKVTVPSNVVGKFRIRIGSHLDHTYKNNQKRWLHGEDPKRPCCVNQLYEKDLIKSETSLLSAYGGLIYVDTEVTAPLGSFTMKFDKVITSPTFTQGKTTNQEWMHMLASTKSPMVEMEVPGVIVTIPKTYFEEVNLNMERCANRYSEMMEAFFDMQGYMMPTPHRQVYDIDTIMGAAHSGYPIVDGTLLTQLTQMGNGTPSHRFDDIWAIPHEIGHNIQDTMWTPSGLWETTNNIFAQYVNEVVFNEYPIPNVPSLKNIEKFKKGRKEFNSLVGWDFENIFKIVQQECSWKTYKMFFKYYNEEIPHALIPQTRDQRFSLMARVLSEKCNKNLVPFFKWWNWPIFDDAEEATKDLPKWEGIIDLLENAKKRDPGLDGSTLSSPTFLGNTENYGSQFSIDGLISTEYKNFFHSEAQNYPWLQIELSAPTELSRVTLVNRKDCCFDRLKNVEIRAGMDGVLPGTVNQLLTINNVCATFQGPAEEKEDVRLRCETPIMAKFITIQSRDRNAVLQMNEFKINGCFKENNTDYYGFDMGSKKTDGEDECAKWCGSTEGCTVWSLRKSDNFCWIKRGDIYTIERANYISGEKACALDVDNFV